MSGCGPIAGAYRDGRALQKEARGYVDSRSSNGIIALASSPNQQQQSYFMCKHSRPSGPSFMPCLLATSKKVVARNRERHILSYVPAIAKAVTTCTILFVQSIVRYHRSCTCIYYDLDFISHRATRSPQELLGSRLPKSQEWLDIPFCTPLCGSVIPRSYNGLSVGTAHRRAQRARCGRAP